MLAILAIGTAFGSPNEAFQLTLIIVLIFAPIATIAVRSCRHSCWSNDILRLDHIAPIRLRSFQIAQNEGILDGLNARLSIELMRTYPISFPQIKRYDRAHQSSIENTSHSLVRTTALTSTNAAR